MFGMDRSAGKRRIAAGLLAGLLGGFAGSGLKVVGEIIDPPRTLGQEAPPAVFAERLLGRTLDTSGRAKATNLMHWTFGPALGMVYGAAAELYPAVTIGYGVVFGWAVLLGTHESVLPMLGLDRPPQQQPLHEQTSELLTHGMYGFGVEAVRRLLMRRLRGAEPDRQAAAAEA